MSSSYGFDLQLGALDFPHTSELHGVSFLPAFERDIQPIVQRYQQHGHTGRLWWGIRSPKAREVTLAIMRAIQEQQPILHDRVRPSLIAADVPVLLTIASDGIALVHRLVPYVIDALVGVGIVAHPSQIVQLFCEQVEPHEKQHTSLSIGLYLNPDTTSMAAHLASKKAVRP